MRLTLPDGSVAEGTAEEIADFERFRASHRLPQTNEQATLEILSGDSEDFTFVSEPFALRVLNRLKLSPAQVRMLRTLYEKGDGWVLATDLHRAVGYSANQFSGLMGAFGRRVVYTPGYVVDSQFFEVEYDYAKGCYRYRLPLTVRKAVKAARVAAP